MNMDFIRSTPQSYEELAAVLKGAAAAYLAAGLSFFPVSPDGSKRPAWQALPPVFDSVTGRNKYPWKPFQERLPTAVEVASWYTGHEFLPTYGMAVVCGPVSGGLELIDFDSIEYFVPWATEVERQAPGLLQRLVHVQSPRPGAHIYFRSAAPEGNQPLARYRMTTNDGQPGTIKTAIETRGVGGYALIPPSPPECHPSMRPYLYQGQRTLVDVPTISVAERQLLIETARRFDQIPHIPIHSFARPQEMREHCTTTSVIDDFNQRGNWHDILTRHGWTMVHADSNGTGHWRRPGKREGGTSATTDYEGRGLFTVFSTNAEPFEGGKTYSRFQAFALLACGGAMQFAVHQLRNLGYGPQGLAAGQRR